MIFDICMKYAIEKKYLLVKKIADWYNKKSRRLPFPPIFIQEFADLSFGVYQRLEKSCRFPDTQKAPALNRSF